MLMPPLFSLAIIIDAAIDKLMLLAPLY